jgi:hypothetical protein
LLAIVRLNKDKLAIFKIRDDIAADARFVVSRLIDAVASMSLANAIIEEPNTTKEPRNKAYPGSSEQPRYGNGAPTLGDYFAKFSILLIKGLQLQPAFTRYRG